MLNVSVYDGFLSRAQAAELFDRLNGRGWTYGWVADASSDCPSRHWHIPLADNGYLARASCLSALETLREFPGLDRLWQKIAEKLPSAHQPTRVYANAHTYGVEGRFHTDCPVGAGEVTSMLYLNPVWKPSWGGATVFSPTTDGTGTYVSPAPGRLIVFPGDVPHCACAPTRECHDLRVTLVFKSRSLP